MAHTAYERTPVHLTFDGSSPLVSVFTFDEGFGLSRKTQTGDTHVPLTLWKFPDAGHDLRHT